METYNNSMAARFAELLTQRETELRALLRASEGLDVPAEAATHEVADFKDAASEQSRATVDDAQADHASHELSLFQAARRRLQDHTYGICLDCGDSIDLRRLTSLPATPYCTPCQSVHEHPAPAPARR
jgi:DnaK suppressor protein